MITNSAGENVSQSAWKVGRAMNPNQVFNHKRILKLFLLSLFNEFSHGINPHPGDRNHRGACFVKLRHLV